MASRQEVGEGKKKKFTSCFAHQGLPVCISPSLFVGLCACACVIQARCRWALESESQIKKGAGVWVCVCVVELGGWEGVGLGSTLTANIEQTAHYSTMPKLFTRLDGAWPSHGNVQTRRELNEHFIGGAPFKEGQNSWRGRGKSQEPSNLASGRREWMQRWRDWSMEQGSWGFAWLKLTKV